MSEIKNIAELEAIYGLPGETSTIKEVDYITPHYRSFIEHSPFAVLATSGPEGIDCSPRGDLPGFVRVVDDKTLMLPDRQGNNRVDLLRNIVRDRHVALLFMIPGISNTLRVNGQADLTRDDNILSSFAIADRAPRTVMIVSVQAVYFQCARAIIRSRLWNEECQLDPKAIPSPGKILAALSDGRVGGEEYDRAWPARAKQTLW